MTNKKVPYPIRVFVWFCVNTFALFALGTTLMDIVDAYTPYTISARLALVSMAWVQLVFYWLLGWFREGNSGGIASTILITITSLFFLEALREVGFLTLTDFSSIYPPGQDDRVLTFSTNLLFSLVAVFYLIESAMNQAKRDYRKGE